MQQLDAAGGVTALVGESSGYVLSSDVVVERNIGTPGKTPVVLPEREGEPALPSFVLSKCGKDCFACGFDPDNLGE